MNKVAVVMGSISDFDVVKKTVDTFKKFNVEPVVKVISAHRTPELAAEFASHAEEEGISVIIAAAGKAAHLGGVLAAFTTLPVIGLPIKSSTMDGMDSLLSIVQMPSGVPVATVAINVSENAALLAIQMLAINDAALRELLKAHKQKMQDDIAIAQDKLDKLLNE
ncbi:MAG: 5-(carboxyamino)imidazole ribonucleotide mutase [Clostridiales bacterium]|nr:5-(carboxyamino)imidazole ribonucleotide mutase [Clostridiales bacterium]